MVKLQTGQESLLSEEEKKALWLFRKNSEVSEITVDSEVSYADEILYAADSTMYNRQSAYLVTDHVQPTSNIVERLFSMCKRTMSDLRKNMGPESLEGSVILRTNKDLWLPCASQLIQEIMLEEAEAAKAARDEASANAALGDDLSDISSVSFTS